MASVVESKPDFHKLQQFIDVTLWIRFHANPPVDKPDPKDFQVFIDWDDYGSAKRTGNGEPCQVKSSDGHIKQYNQHLLAVTRPHRYPTPGPKHVTINVYGKHAKKSPYECSLVCIIDVKKGVLPSQGFQFQFPPIPQIPVTPLPTADDLAKKIPQGNFGSFGGMAGAADKFGH